MISAAESFVAMLGDVEQTAEWRISIDVPEYANPAAVFDASEIQIDASMTTDQPNQSRLLEGYPTMQAQFTLSGLVDKTDETKTIAWLVGRYSNTSPLWGIDLHGRTVTVDLDAYPDGCAGVPVSVRKFAGTIDTYTQGSDGTVQFTCLDARNTLRASPTTQPVITAPPWDAGLTAEYAVDALLRGASNMTISSWPAQRNKCILAAGMRTSVWPEVGTLGGGTALQAPPLFDTGTFGSALSSLGPAGVAGLTYTFAQPVNFASHVVEILRWGPTTGQTVIAINSQVGASAWNIARNGANITVTPISGTAYTFTGVLNTSGAGQYVAFHFTEGGGTWKVDMRVDSTTYSTGSQAGSASELPQPGETLELLEVNGTIEGLQVTNETSPAWNNGFVPRAILDPSLNALQIVPGYSGDPFQVIQQIAAAEYAYAGFDEDGVLFRFVNRNTLTQQDVAWTVTSETDLASLSIESSSASVINRAQIGWTGWKFAKKNSTVYSAGTPRRIPPRGNLQIRAKLNSYAINIDTTPAVLPAGATDGAGDPADPTTSWYRASTDKAGVNEYTGPLTWDFTQPAPDVLLINVGNPSGNTVYFASSANYTEADIAAGDPSLWIAGQLVTQQAEVVEDYQYPPADYVWPDGRTGAAGSRFGEVAYQATGNPWNQDPDSAAQLAQDTVLAQWTPKPNLIEVSIRPNPLLQRGDLIRITDDADTGVDEYALLFGWTITYRVNDDDTVDYSMTIDARTIAAPRAWIAGVAGRSEAGVTTYATPA